MLLQVKLFKILQIGPGGIKAGAGGVHQALKVTFMVARSKHRVEDDRQELAREADEVSILPIEVRDMSDVPEAGRVIEKNEDPSGDRMAAPQHRVWVQHDGEHAAVGQWMRK